MLKYSILFIAVSLIAPSTQAITLNQYVEDVILNKPQVMQRIHTYRQIVEDENIAARGWRPKVDLSFSTGAYSTKSPITNLDRQNYGSYRSDLIVTQNLFNGYDTTNAVKQAQARILSELNRVFDEADNAALEGITYYFEVLKQQRILELADMNVEAHEKILEKIHQRNISGVGRKSEEEQIRGRLAQARAGVIAQKNNLEDALTRIHSSLGRYIALQDFEKPEIPIVPRGDIDALLDSAFNIHPAMKSAALNIKAAEFDYARAKKNNYPQVDVQLTKTVGDDISGYNGETDDLSAAINLTYNLYNGGADKAARRQKLSAVYEHRAYSVRVKRQIVEVLRLAWTAQQALHSQFEHLDDYARRMDKTFQLYLEEFQVGRRDLLDLLDAESERNTAQVIRARAYYDGLISIYRVYEGGGQLFNALGLDVVLQDEQLRMVTLEVNDIDRLPFSSDEDTDGEENAYDHCDSTPKGTKVNEYGCGVVLNPVFGILEKQQTDRRVENLNFIYKTNNLTSDSLRSVQLLINDLKSTAPDSHIHIYAYSDSIGSAGYNLKLSQTRADAIKDILVKAGFKASLVTAVGKGESDPVADNNTAEGRAKNRRVEFMIMPKVNVSNTVISENLTFAYKSEDLTDEGKNNLNEVLKQLNEFSRNSHIKVNAYSDNIGSTSYNSELSQRRANRVKQYLVEAGFDRSQINATGMGELNPIADNATEEGRAKNRRVEFLVMDI